jgi:hypothetical protein
MSNDKELAALVDTYTFGLISQKLLATRKVIDEVTVTYGEVEQEIGDRILKLRGTHVPLDEVYKYSSSSCKTCGYGRGYFISNIPKAKYPNPRGLLVLEPEVPSDLTEEQKQDRAAQLSKEPTWKIVNVCKCASEKALLKNPSWVSTANRNVFIALDFNFVDKPLDEIVETVVETEVSPVIENIEDQEIVQEQLDNAN